VRIDHWPDFRISTPQTVSLAFYVAKPDHAAADDVAETEGIAMYRTIALLIGSGVAVLLTDGSLVYPPYTRPTLIAHRGASGYAPEHTMASYRLAMEQGADFVEPDLQISKDRVLICMHDTSLERTTNVRQVFPERAREINGRKTWPVVDFTLAEIKSLDAGSWMDPKFAGQKVVTFQEMIDEVKGKAGLYPETKEPEFYGKHGLKMEKLLMEVLAKNGLDQPGANPKTPIVIQSFSADSLKILRKDLGCKLPLVFLVFNDKTSQYTTPEGLKRVKGFADGIGPEKGIILRRPELVKDAHDLGLSVTSWTFGSKRPSKFGDVRKEMSYFLHDLKVDALFTDNPDQFPRD
jgi:glycerophosphoryl diester phosphodiesterase